MPNLSFFNALTAQWPRHPDELAVAFFRGGRIESEMTYGTLTDAIDRVAGALAHNAVEPGDRVVLFLEKSLFTALAHLAVLRLGAVSVPLNPGFTASEMAYLLADAEPRLVLAEPANAAIVERAASGVPRLVVDTGDPLERIAFCDHAPPSLPQIDSRPDDPALIVYTSGTTGDPKGAVLTQANLSHDARTIIAIWKIGAADGLCHALPLFHVHGLCFALHTCLMAGARVLLLDRFVAANVLDVLTTARGPHASSIFMAVPAMYAKLMAHLGDRRPDFSHLRLLTSGSAPLLEADFARIADVFGREPVEREGMSETGMNFSNPLAGPRKPGSIGLPLSGLAVRIVDPETSADVPPSQVGELWLQGPGITPGYWRKPDRTAEAFVGGWFRTGDLGRVDADGYFYLTDRIKHIIISGGENVSAKEVETVINRCAGVVESAVVGVPDPGWGEAVAAAVVAGPGAGVTPEGVQAYCRAHLHPWKCPKTVLLIDGLPRNTMGKVLKERVKALFAVDHRF